MLELSPSAPPDGAVRLAHRTDPPEPGRRESLGMRLIRPLLGLSIGSVLALSAVGVAMGMPVKLPLRSGPAHGLTRDMAHRVDRALAAAREAGVPLEVTSGFRTAAYQQFLLERAIKRYGSREEATKWVLPPEDSAHVQGEAVDVGPPQGALWLEAHGAAFGLCRRYLNEPWHFEPRVSPGGTCPPMQAHPLARH